MNIRLGCVHASESASQVLLVFTWGSDFLGASSAALGVLPYQLPRLVSSGAMLARSAKSHGPPNVWISDARIRACQTVSDKGSVFLCLLQCLSWEEVVAVAGMLRMGRGEKRSLVTCVRSLLEFPAPRCRMGCWHDKVRMRSSYTGLPGLLRGFLCFSGCQQLGADREGATLPCLLGKQHAPSLLAPWRSGLLGFPLWVRVAVVERPL